MSDEFGSFDDELDDLDFDSLGEIDEGGSRKPATFIRNVGSGLLDDLKNSDSEDVKNVVGKAFRVAGGKDGNLVADKVGTFAQEMRETSNQLRKGLSPLVQSLKRVGGNSLLGRVINRIDERLGITGTSASSLRTQSDSEREAEEANQRMIDALGQQRSEEERRTLLMQATQHNMSKNQLTALNKIAGFQSRQLSFFNNIAGKYYRRSLENQYKQLFLMKRHLKTTARGLDMISKELHVVGKNTGLPDFAKLRTVEAMKGEVRRRATNRVFESAIKNNNWLDSLQKKADRVRNNLTDMVTGGAEGAEGMLGMGEMMGDMPPEMIASMQIKDLIVMSVGKKLGDVVKKFDKDGKGADFLADPSFGLRQLEDRSKSGMAKKFYGTMAKLFDANSDYSSTRSVHKDDPNDVTLFDNRTKLSITRVIPTYLSKILAEVKGARTGKQEGELRFDYAGNRFIDSKNFEENLINVRMGAAVDRSGAASRGSWFLSNLKEGDTNGLVDKYQKVILKSVLDRAKSGKAIRYKSMLQDGFFEQFGENADEMASLFDNAEAVTDARGYVTGILRFKELIEEMIDNGHVEGLAKARIIKYNPKDDEWELDETKLFDRNVDILIKRVLDDVNKSSNSTGWKEEKNKAEGKENPKTFKEKVKDVYDKVAATDIAKDIKSGKTLDDAGEKLKKLETEIQGLEKLDFSKENAKKKLDALADRVKKEAEENPNPKIQAALKGILGLKKTVEESSVFAQAKNLFKRADASDIVKDIKSGEAFKKDGRILSAIGKKVKKLNLSKDGAKEKLDEMIDKVQEVYERTPNKSVKLILDTMIDLRKDIGAKADKNISKTTKTLMNDLHTLTTGKGNLKKAAKNLVTNATAASGLMSVFDGDGDGDRDGNWKDRAKMFKTTRQPTKEVDESKARDSTLFKTLGLISGIMMLPLKFLGAITGIGGSFLGGALGGLTNRFGNLARGGYNMSRQALGPLLSVFNPANIAEGYRSIFKPLFTDLLKGLKNALSHIGTKFAKLFKDIIPRALKHIMEKLSPKSLWEGLKKLGRDFTTFLKQNKLTGRLFEKMSKNLSALKEAAKNKTLITTIKEGLKTRLKATGELISKLSKAIYDRTIGPMAKLGEAITKDLLPGKWITAIENVGDSIVKKLHSIIHGGKSAEPGLIHAMKGMFAAQTERLASVVKAVVPKSVWEQSKEFLSKAGSKVADKFSAGKKWIGDKLSSAGKVVGDFTSGIKKKGMYYARQGAVRAVALYENTVDDIKTAGKNVWNWMKNTNVAQWGKKHWELLRKDGIKYVKPILEKAFKGVGWLLKRIPWILKRIPLVAIGVSIYFAFQCIKAGDFKGAALNMVSGILASIPTPWTLAASIALDVFLAFTHHCAARSDKEKELEKQLAGMSPEQREAFEKARAKVVANMTLKDKLKVSHEREAAAYAAVDKAEWDEETKAQKKGTIRKAYELERFNIKAKDTIGNSSVMKSIKSGYNKTLNYVTGADDVEKSTAGVPVSVHMKAKTNPVEAKRVVDKYDAQLKAVNATIKQLKKVSPDHPSLKILEARKKEILRLKTELKPTVRKTSNAVPPPFKMGNTGARPVNNANRGGFNLGDPNANPTNVGDNVLASLSHMGIYTGGNESLDKIIRDPSVLKRLAKAKDPVELLKLVQKEGIIDKANARYIDYMQNPQKLLGLFVEKAGLGKNAKQLINSPIISKIIKKQKVTAEELASAAIDGGLLDSKAGGMLKKLLPAFKTLTSGQKLNPNSFLDVIKNTGLVKGDVVDSARQLLDVRSSTGPRAAANTPLIDTAPTNHTPNKTPTTPDHVGGKIGRGATIHDAAETKPATTPPPKKGAICTDLKSFLAELCKTESSCNYKLKPNSSGYMGKYQFRFRNGKKGPDDGLKFLRMMPGVSQVQWFNSEALQEKHMLIAMKYYDNDLRKKGIPVNNWTRWLRHNMGASGAHAILVGRLTSKIRRNIKNQSVHGRTDKELIANYTKKFKHRFVKCLDGSGGSGTTGATDAEHPDGLKAKDTIKGVNAAKTKMGGNKAGGLLSSIVGAVGSGPLAVVKAAINGLIQFLTGMSPFGNENTEDESGSEMGGGPGGGELGASDAPITAMDNYNKNDAKSLNMDAPAHTPADTALDGSGDKAGSKDGKAGKKVSITDDDIKGLHFIDIRSNKTGNGKYNTKRAEFNNRSQATVGILYHATQGGSVTSSMNWVYELQPKQKRLRLGAHFWIARSGKIYLAHDPKVFVHHADGPSRKKGPGSNGFIGIEIAGRYKGGRWERLTGAQKSAVTKLTLYLHKKYGNLKHLHHGDRRLWNKTVGEGLEAMHVGDAAIKGKSFKGESADSPIDATKVGGGGGGGATPAVPKPAGLGGGSGAGVVEKDDNKSAITAADGNKTQTAPGGGAGPTAGGGASVGDHDHDLPEDKRKPVDGQKHDLGSGDEDGEDEKEKGGKGGAGGSTAEGGDGTTSSAPANPTNATSLSDPTPKQGGGETAGPSSVPTSGSTPLASGASTPGSAATIDHTDFIESVKKIISIMRAMLKANPKLTEAHVASVRNTAHSLFDTEQYALLMNGYKNMNISAFSTFSKSDKVVLADYYQILMQFNKAHGKVHPADYMKRMDAFILALRGGGAATETTPLAGGVPSTYGTDIPAAQGILPSPASQSAPLPEGAKNDVTNAAVAADGSNVATGGKAGTADGGVENKGTGVSEKDVSGMKVQDVFDIAAGKMEQWNGLNPVFKKRLLQIGAYWLKKYGNKIKFTSGFRSPKYQEALYKRSKGSGMVAPPGRSSHNYGYAADLGNLRNGPSTPMSILDSEGILAKYKLYRPLANSKHREDWHVEPVETKGHRGAKLKDLHLGGETAQSDMGNHGVGGDGGVGNSVGGMGGGGGNMLTGLGNAIGGEAGGFLGLLGNIANMFMGNDKNSLGEKTMVEKIREGSHLKSYFDGSNGSKDYSGHFNRLGGSQDRGNTHLAGIEKHMSTLVQSNQRLEAAISSSNIDTESNDVESSKQVNMSDHVAYPMAKTTAMRVHE